MARDTSNIAKLEAYRHGDLYQALLQAGFELSRAGDAFLHARQMLCSVGMGYLGFAQAEPDLLRTAFSVPADLQTAARRSKAGNLGMTPFQLLFAT